jgi:hypothetical protein
MQAAREKEDHVGEFIAIRNEQYQREQEARERLER